MATSMQAQSMREAQPSGADARAFFNHLVGRLSSDGMLSMSHADIEEALHRDGLELMRLLFQDHLTLRAARETGREVIGADGVERVERRRMRRQLMTRFGAVEVSRLSYGAEEVASLRPMDAELNLPAEHASLGLRRLAAETAAVSSFDETLAAMRRATAATTGKRQIEQLVERAASEFDAFYAEREALARHEAARTGSILVLSTDGKGVVMRPEGLREATRKAAERAKPKLATRLSPGEKTNRKRMAQVAAVYTVAPYIRTPDQVLGGASGLAQAQSRPRPEAKRVWASLTDDAREVIEAMFDEAERRDPARLKRWAAVVDGNRTQMDLVRAEAKRRGVNLTIVLDLVHVIEYVWGAAWCFFDKGDTAVEAWVGARVLQILEGRASHVAAGIRRSATLRGLTSAERARADDCADYLLNNAEHCRYDRYLAAGMPIASGVIEGACRHLISDRLDITGARWSLAGAEAVLKLRSLRSSGDFDEYWAFHQRAHREYVHTDRYADGVVPQPEPMSPTPLTKTQRSLRLVPPLTTE